MTIPISRKTIAVAMFWITRAVKLLRWKPPSRACSTNTQAATGIASTNTIKKAVNA